MKQLLAFALIASLTSVVSAQTEKQGVTYRSPGGATLKLMLDDSNVAARWAKEP